MSFEKVTSPSMVGNPPASIDNPVAIPSAAIRATGLTEGISLFIRTSPRSKLPIEQLN
jgi:hypothetical protein